MRIISQADLLGDQREDGLLRFSLASPRFPVEGRPPFTHPAATLKGAQKPAAWIPLGAIRGKVCAHTHINTHVPKLRGVLSPHRKCTNGIRGSQTYAHPHRRGTHRDTHRLVHTHTDRHACRHTCPSWKTHRPLKKYTNRVQDPWTRAHACVHACTHTHPGWQADRPPHKQAQTHIHRHTRMCMCVHECVPKHRHTLQKCPNTPHS